jgi:hypothetical protein
MKNRGLLVGLVCFGILISAIVGIAIIPVEVNSFFYTNETSLVIPLENYFSFPVLNYLLNVRGKANVDVNKNNLEIKNIEEDLNISLVAFFKEENFTQDFFIYYNKNEEIIVYENLCYVLINNEKISYEDYLIKLRIDEIKEILKNE